MHQQLGAGARNENTHVAVDDERVRAVFAAGDEFLEDVWRASADGEARDVLVGLGEGAPREERHVRPAGVVDPDALHYVPLFSSPIGCGPAVQHSVHRLPARYVVCFWDGEVQARSLRDEGVFRVQGRGCTGGELDAGAGGALGEDVVGEAIFDGAGDAGARDPDVDMLDLH